jgi:uncharacterized protein YbaP (TraB family)
MNVHSAFTPLRRCCLLPVLLLAVWVGWFGAAHGQIYQWRDAQGALHFSDAPPSDVSPHVLKENQIQPPQQSATSSPKLSGGDIQFSPASSGGMFWRIDDNAGRSPSYLLGTIHSDDERVLRLPEPVVTAFETSDTFVMEMEMEAGVMIQVGSAMLFTDQRDLRSLLGEPLYRRTVQIMARYGIPEMALLKMKPWAVMAILSMPMPKTGKVLDMVLHQKARQTGKTVHGLESAAEQLAVFDQMSMADQISLLKETLNQVDRLPELFEEMLRRYLEDNLAGIAGFARQFHQGDDSQALQRFMVRLNDQRNLRMVERMKPYLDQGGVFVAVGALHLAGDTGIVALLRQRGYCVSPIPLVRRP